MSVVKVINLVDAHVKVTNTGMSDLRARLGRALVSALVITYYGIPTIWLRQLELRRSVFVKTIISQVDAVEICGHSQCTQ